MRDLHVTAFSYEDSLEVWVRVLYFYPLIKILSSKFILTILRRDTNSDSSWILSSPTSSPQLCHFITGTLTIGITLFLNSLNFWSTILVGCTSNDKSSLKSISGASNTWDRSRMYFLSIDTWYTLWIRSKSCGNSNRYAIGPIFSKILNGLIYRGFNLPFV